MLIYVFREENLAKIARRVKDYKVEELNPPREGKRLLVLDVDYTLFGELLWQESDWDTTDCFSFLLKWLLESQDVLHTNNP